MTGPGDRRADGSAADRFGDFLDALVRGQSPDAPTPASDDARALEEAARDLHSRAAQERGVSPTPAQLAAIWTEVSMDIPLIASGQELPLVQPLRQETPPRIIQWTGRRLAAPRAWLVTAIAAVLVLGLVAAMHDGGERANSPTYAAGNSGPTLGAVQGISSPEVIPPLMVAGTCPTLTADQKQEAYAIAGAAATPDRTQPLPTVTIPALDLGGPVPDSETQAAIFATWQAFHACSTPTSQNLLALVFLTTQQGTSFIFSHPVDALRAIAGYSDPGTGALVPPPLEPMQVLADGRVVAFIDLGAMQSPTARNYVIFANVDGVWKIDVLAIDLGVPGGAS
jgi:hypothetical protein